MINLIKAENYEEVNKAIDNGYKFSEYGEELCYLTCNDNFDVSLVEKMIKNGAKVDVSLFGFTPLFNISYVNRKDVAECLIKNGANVKTKVGSTCLMNCVSGSEFSFDYFVFLIENGATIKDKDVDNETIVDYAINSSKSIEVVNIIKDIYEHNYSIEEIKRICLGNNVLIFESDTKRIKSLFDSWNYMLKTVGIIRFNEEELSDIDKKNFNDLKKLISACCYYEAFQKLNSIAGDLTKRRTVNLYFFMLDILIGVDLIEESKIVIDWLIKMIDYNKLNSKYGSCCNEYLNKINMICNNSNEKLLDLKKIIKNLQKQEKVCLYTNRAVLFTQRVFCKIHQLNDKWFL